MQNIKNDYKRERRRVLRLINNYKKKGYDVEVAIPKLVKKPTQASIRRLKKITPQLIRKESYAPDLETGEKINFYTYKIRYPKSTPYQANNVLLNGGIYANDMNILYFERVVANYPDRIENMVLTKLRGAIDVYGTVAVDNALSEMINSGSIIEPSDGYNYHLVSEMMEDLATLLRMDESERKATHDAFLGELDSQEYYDGEFDGWY